MITLAHENHNLCMDAGTGHGLLMDQHFGSNLSGTAKLEKDAIKDWGEDIRIQPRGVNPAISSNRYISCQFRILLGVEEPL